MKYFVFVSNPMNIRKREYWTFKALLIRFVTSVILNVTVKVIANKIIEKNNSISDLSSDEIWASIESSTVNS